MYLKCTNEEVVQEHCQRLMILKVDAIIGSRVRRTTRKDEIRRKGNGEWEEEETGRPVGVPMCYHEVDQPGLFERACGPTMPTPGERPRRTSLVHYILYTFSCGRRGCATGVFPVAALSTASKGASPAARLKDAQVHSWKFATWQVASSRAT